MQRPTDPHRGHDEELFRREALRALQLQRQRCEQRLARQQVIFRAAMALCASGCVLAVLGVPQGGVLLIVSVLFSRMSLSR